MLPLTARALYAFLLFYFYSSIFFFYSQKQINTNEQKVKKFSFFHKETHNMNKKWLNEFLTYFYARET